MKPLFSTLILFSALVFAPSGFALDCAWTQFDEDGARGAILENVQPKKKTKIVDGYRFVLSSEQTASGEYEERITLRRRGKTIAPVSSRFLYEGTRYEGIETRFGPETSGLTIRCYW